MLKLKSVKSFVWDKGNIDKNWTKHKVKNVECESAFLDKSKVSFKDVLHSKEEKRYILLGKTKQGKLLFVVFTKRSDGIRIISARDTKNKERKLYEEANKNSKV